MRYKIGHAVYIMPREEYEFIALAKASRLPEICRYFNLRMVPYFGLKASITDAETLSDGTELYRLDVDKGENAWDGRLLRIDG